MLWSGRQPMGSAVDRAIERARNALRLAYLCRLCIVGGLALSAPELAHAQAPIGLVTPGMTQTELQSILGPPDYIQVKGLRQAWQYCPRFFDRFFDRVFDRGGVLYVTVWFADGQVEHMRAYQSSAMGSCPDFFAAFRWEDGLYGGASAAFGK